MPRTATLTAATGTSRVPITTHGDKPGMGRQNDEPARRARIRRHLTRETRRINQHIKHLSKDDLGRLEGIINDLAQTHDDDDACAKLCTYWGDLHPPWGTRYAPAMERAILIVFSRRRPK